LINAYKSATQEALQIAEIVEKTVNDVYEVTFDYIQMNDVMRIIKETEVIVLSQDFDTKCKITFEIRKLQVNEVIGRMEKIEGLTINYLRTI
jgi:putative IMPACT (imprinted ancient) family translation regulator